MKKNQFLIPFIALILSGISSASHSAEEGRFFFGLSGGYQRYYGYFSSNMAQPGYSYNVECKEHFSISPFASLIAGYKLNNNLKIGLSFSHNIGDNESKFQKDNDGNYGRIVKVLNSWDIAGNLIYYTNPDSAFSPLIGAKLGYNSRAVDIDPKSKDVFDKTKNNKKNNSGILLGAIAGISYKLNDTTRIELTYSIDKQSNAETTYRATSSINEIIIAPNLSHKVALGMTFAF